GMYIPKPFELLFSWIEDKGLFIEAKDGHRVGFLFPEDQLKAGWTEEERPGGTDIEFFAQGNADLKYWFGHERPDVLNRLCVFAQTGADGSVAALWLDEDGKQKIVHMGSGSGSALVCVLADDPIDFLRLVAIGYDEICWSEEFEYPPNSGQAGSEIFVHPNVAYQNWVKETFSVSIPEKAIEIVKYPSEMGDANSSDPFCRWVEKHTQLS
ncbi:MAG TPA: SMI1/KNR4 family protein, partial [Blastocatellia bacterium]|nr:SMI1/KNR4 family protein [Blastocatellia bacterium]